MKPWLLFLALKKKIKQKQAGWCLGTGLGLGWRSRKPQGPYMTVLELTASFRVRMWDGKSRPGVCEFSLQEYGDIHLTLRGTPREGRLYPRAVLPHSK